MAEVIESFYLRERYTVDWKKVDEWFNNRIEEILKEGLKGKGRGELKR